MNQKELKVTGLFYLPMLDGETQEQAENRLEKLLEQIGITLNNSCCEFEEQDM
jgi:hypothetical protein